MDTNYVKALAYTKENMVECISCLDVMSGIYDDRIRDTCTECKGKAKT